MATRRPGPSLRNMPAETTMRQTFTLAIDILFVLLVPLLGIAAWVVVVRPDAQAVVALDREADRSDDSVLGLFGGLPRAWPDDEAGPDSAADWMAELLDEDEAAAPASAQAVADAVPRRPGRLDEFVPEAGQPWLAAALLACTLCGKSIFARRFPQADDEHDYYRKKRGQRVAGDRPESSKVPLAADGRGAPLIHASLHAK